jgi:hypothetical protein|tara:strand:+ start:304 stop:636 length:333 start_codon:yes stop_codon:yes gene_type:complete
MFAQNMTLAKSNEFFEKQVWHKTYLGLEKKIKKGTKLTYFDKVFLTMINTEHSIYDLDEIMNSNQDSKNKLTYYIGAIKKLIEKGYVTQIHNPEVTNKYYGHKFQINIII